MAEDLWVTLARYVARFEPELRRAFLRAAATMRASVDLTELVRLLERGAVEAAAHLLLTAGAPWEALGDASISTLMQAASEGTARVYGPSGERAGGLTVLTGLRQFGTTLDAHAGELITQVSEESRKAIVGYITRATRAGINPVSLVPQLVGYVQADGARVGGIVGLTQRQANAVLNYRAALERRSVSALQRQLRDRRFDATVTANSLRLPDGRLNPAYRPMTAEQIDKVVARYEARMLAYRAQVIARTESMRAQRGGQRLGWEIAVRDGLIDPDLLRRSWHTALDERVRHDHRVMQGIEVGFDEAFDTPDQGLILNPSAPNCRCVIWIQPDYTRAGAPPAPDPTEWDLAA